MRECIFAFSSGGPSGFNGKNFFFVAAWFGHSVLKKNLFGWRQLNQQRVFEVANDIKIDTLSKQKILGLYKWPTTYGQNMADSDDDDDDETSMNNLNYICNTTTKNHQTSS